VIIKLKNKYSLNSSWVLTAAHCSTGVNARNVEVHLHRHQITLSDSQEDGIVAAVDEILIHPDYRYHLSKFGKLSTLKNLELVRLPLTTMLLCGT